MFLASPHRSVTDQTPALLAVNGCITKISTSGPVTLLRSPCRSRVPPDSMLAQCMDWPKSSSTVWKPRKASICSPKTQEFNSWKASNSDFFGWNRLWNQNCSASSRSPCGRPKQSHRWARQWPCSLTRLLLFWGVMWVLPKTGGPNNLGVESCLPYWIGDLSYTTPFYLGPRHLSSQMATLWCAETIDNSWVPSGYVTVWDIVGIPQILCLNGSAFFCISKKVNAWIQSD